MRMQEKAMGLLKSDVFMGEGALLKSWRSAHQYICLLLQDFCDARFGNKCCKGKDKWATKIRESDQESSSVGHRSPQISLDQSDGQIDLFTGEPPICS